MSRFRGPRLKIMRALGVQLPGLSRKSIERRPYAPGQHGQNKKGKKSEFGNQLAEKQKIRLNYGLGERQFRRVVSDALRSRAVTGDKLLELLERRLDNVVFRAGLAPTIPAARQLVNHGHITVDGKKVSIPSFRTKPGQVISASTKAKENGHVKASLENPSLIRPSWIETDPASAQAKIVAMPDRAQVPFEVNERLVIEFYSQRVRG